MKWLVVSLFVLGSTACGSDASAPDTPRTRSNAVRSQEAASNSSDQGGVAVFDAAVPMRSESDEPVDAGHAETARPANGGSGGSRSAGKAGASGQRAGDSQMVDAGMRASSSSSQSMRDAGEADSATSPPKPDASAAADAASEIDAGDGAVDAAPPVAMNSGSCCSPSDKPGCGDAALRECVCARQPSCCSEAWDAACTRIVAEKFCQGGVRDCVCGSADGQWQQAQCCDESWDDTCESVATIKCSATPDCG